MDARATCPSSPLGSASRPDPSRPRTQSDPFRTQVQTTGHGFGATRRLLRKTQFDEVLRSASIRTARGPLRLAARENRLEFARLGLIVGRRMLPKAVDRNRAKRVIRESFRQACGLPTMDIVVRVTVPRVNVAVGDAERLFRALADIVARRRKAESPRRVE